MTQAKRFAVLNVHAFLRYLSILAAVVAIARAIDLEEGPTEHGVVVALVQGGSSDWVCEDGGREKDEEVEDGQLDHGGWRRD